MKMLNHEKRLTKNKNISFKLSLSIITKGV